MDAQHLHILILAENESHYRAVNQLLSGIKNLSFEVIWAAGLEATLPTLVNRQADIVISILPLNQADPLSLIHQTITQENNLPLILLAEIVDWKFALTALTMGAADYLDLNCLDSLTLERSIRYAVERVRIWGALHESEERYRQLLELSPDGVVLHREGTILFCNPVGAHLMGATSPGQIQGHSIAEFIHPDYLGIVNQRIKQILTEGQPASLLEEKFVGLDGRVIDVEVVSSSITYQGQPVIQTVVRDITEHKKTSQALQEAYAQMETRVIQRTTELQKANERLIALYNIGQLIATPLKLELVLDTIARQAVNLLESEGSAILLFDEVTQILTIKGGFGLNESLVKNARIKVGDSLAGRVVQTGQPLIVNNLPVDPQFNSSIAAKEGFLAIIITPLLVGQKIIGTLDVHSKTNPTAFTEEHLQILNMLAGQAAIVIENAHLYEALQQAHNELELRIQERTTELLNMNEQLQTEITERQQLAQHIQESLTHRARQVETITRVTQEIAAAPALDELFRRVVHLVQEQFGYYHVHVYTLERVATPEKRQPEANYLVMQEGTGQVGRIMKAARHKIPLAAEKSLVARAARSGEPVRVDDVFKDPNWLPNALLPETRAEIAVPITLHNIILGVLDVQNDAIDSLNAEDQLLLLSLCGQIAIAIDYRRAESERLRAEAALRQSEATNRALLEAIPDAIFELDSQGIYLNYISAQGFEPFVPPAEFIGKKQTEILPMEIGVPLQHLLALTVQTGQMHLYEYPLSIGDEINYYEARLVTSGPDRVLEIIRDVTLRKRAEESLQQRTHQLEVLREVGLELTTQLNLETLLHSIVARAVELLNGISGGLYLYRSESEVLELMVTVGLDPALVGTKLQSGEGLTGAVWQTGQTLIVDDYRNWDNKASVYRNTGWTAIVGVPIRWGDEFLGVLDVIGDAPRAFSATHAQLLGMFATQAANAIRNAHLYDHAQREITQRKLAEEALKAYSGRLEEMVDERTRELQKTQERLIRQEKLAFLGQLAGGVGHELRNPLGVISNAVYFLQMVLSDSDEMVKEYLEIISNRVHEAEKIVSDLLDFSRNRPAAREKIPIFDLITEVIAQHPLPDTIQLTTTLPPDLPPVFIDPQQIKQVLINLVTNAYQAMPSGGQLIIQAQMEQNEVKLAVTDTGMGMSMDTLTQIFEPLFTTKPKGIGLGLAVSKNLVEANGGNIKVISLPGEGTTFTVALPVGASA